MRPHDEPAYRTRAHPTPDQQIRELARILMAFHR
jgi:hypothetical protein